MIRYKRGGFHQLGNLCKLSGSVFPQSFFVALPIATVTTLLFWIQYKDAVEAGEALNDNVLRDNAVWNGFSFLVGFLIVFRTSQCYVRFWEACTSTHSMRAEWFDACSSLVAFARHSSAGEEKVKHFENILIRLFSMLHCSALASIVDNLSMPDDQIEAYSFPLIDAAGFDAESIIYISQTSNKTEMIFQWIQQFIVDSIKSGVMTIPPPIVSRSFQEMSNGMVQFHEAGKISVIPFPFPYAQTCDLLLVLHGLVVPFVTCQWVLTWYWAFIFSFVQVFVMWSLNFIAIELEDPFGCDANDINMRELQVEMNEHLLLLLRPGTKRVPDLTPKAQDLTAELGSQGRDEFKRCTVKGASFRDMWKAVEVERSKHNPVVRRTSMKDREMGDASETTNGSCLVEMSTSSHFKARPGPGAMRQCRRWCRRQGLACGLLAPRDRVPKGPADPKAHLPVSLSKMANLGDSSTSSSRSSSIMALDIPTPSENPVNRTVLADNHGLAVRPPEDKPPIAHSTWKEQLLTSSAHRPQPIPHSEPPGSGGGDFAVPLEATPRIYQAGTEPPTLQAASVRWV